MFMVLKFGKKHVGWVFVKNRKLGRNWRKDFVIFWNVSWLINHLFDMPLKVLEVYFENV